MEVGKYLGMNINGNTTYQIKWDTAKVLCRQKFIVSNVCFRKEN